MPELSLSLLIQFIANGFVVGMYYTLLALGLSIIFGLIGVINLAHGALYALGAYAAYVFSRHLGFFPALVLSPLIVAVLAMAIEVTMLRRLYLKDPLLSLLLTFGLAMVVEQLLRMIFGAAGLPFDIPQRLQGFVRFGMFPYSRYRLFLLIVGILVIALLWWFLERTPYGRIIRAGTRDPEMVRILGIRLAPVFTAVFGIGAAMAGLAGVISAPLAGVEPAMGTAVGTAAFVVVVIGGMGSFWGPVIAGLLVGEIVSLFVLLYPPAADASMFLLMALVLLLRPRGLLGERWEKFE
jgi:branched-chain amino acid transport system permease protein